ncbi:MAG: PAS domain S-box protein [Pseudohongiella sp.]|nr:PAS domain S-box protein [Pseudohongiella sp.]
MEETQKESAPIEAESEAGLFLDAILENIIDSIVTIDGNGIILSVNKHTETLFGYPRAELLGSNIKMLMPSPYRSEHDKYINNYLETGVKKIIGKGREVYGRNKNGKTFPINLAISEFVWRDKHSFIGIIRDITDSVEVKRKIQQVEELGLLNEELEQFNYIVSHDLRAPLRAMHNYADFLTEDMEEKLDSTDRKYLAGLKKAVTECNTLIEDLLTLSKIGRDKIVIIDDVDLGEILDDVLRPLIESTDISILKDSTWPRISTHPGLLKQILTNLISNAIKFNESNPKQIRLSHREVGDSAIELIIEDNGIGIDEKYISTILKPFKRLHTSEEYEGTGIGLAIVQKAVKYLAGEMRIQSAIGEGTTVCIQLPG